MTIDLSHLNGGGTPASGSGSLDLSGVPQGGGGGGMATNYANSSAVPWQDQWMYSQIFAGFEAHKSQVRNTQHGGAGKSIEEFGPTHGTRRPKYLTPFALLQQFDSLSTKDYYKFKNQLVAAGFVSPSADPVTVRDAYAAVLKDVQQMQGQGANVTFKSYVHSLIAKNGLDAGKIPSKPNWDPTAKKAAGFTPSTSTATSVYDLDPAQAQDMLTQLLQQKLGRDPSQAEIEDFVDAVKTRAAQDPTTVTEKVRRGDLSNLADGNTQVQVTKQGGQTYSQVTSTNQGFGAADAGLLAQKRAQNAPDYRSYQAVATYFPALVQALGSTV